MDYNFLYRKGVKKIAIYISQLGRWIPDHIYLSLLYMIRTGKRLDLQKPRRFNEKIQWLKLYDRKEIYTRWVDKFEAKKLAMELIGGEHIIGTLAVAGAFEDIDINTLPDRFVIKCTHDSGGVFICHDKQTFNFIETAKKVNKALKRNYYYQNREWAYKGVIPRVIVEEYVETPNGKEIIDYKFMCFDGKVKCIFTCSERYTGDGLKVTFFDTNWKRMPFERHYPSSIVEIEKPAQLSLMIAMAEKLSKDIPFVRVDMYEVGDKIYFGEMTFYPGSGMEEFRPDDWDYILGDWINIDKVGNGKSFLL